MKLLIVVDTYNIAADTSPLGMEHQNSWSAFLHAYLVAHNPDADLAIIWEVRGKTQVKAGEGGERDVVLEELVKQQVRDAWVAWCGSAVEA